MEHLQNQLIKKEKKIGTDMLKVLNLCIWEMRTYILSVTPNKIDVYLSDQALRHVSVPVSVIVSGYVLRFKHSGGHCRVLFFFFFDNLIFRNFRS